MIALTKKIMIDPGHAPGNVNRGKNGYYEYAGMWELSLYLKAMLEKKRVRCRADPRQGY
jgi:N-acetylmuramoyl-L-alanine amidase